MSVYVLMMFVGTEEAFSLQNTDLGLLKSVSNAVKYRLFWDEILKNFGDGLLPRSHLQMGVI